MSIWTHNRLKWDKSEWISFAITFSILILYPLMSGYPFINWDSWGYASGSCPSNIRSPVLGCAMRPVVLLGGPWGFVIAQSAVTAYLLVFLSNLVLKRYHNKYVFYIAIIIAGVGIHTGSLMADVWTLIGFICLFVISIGYVYPIMAILLAISYAVHFGNFIVYTATAFLFLFFVKYKLKYITTILFCLLGAFVLIITANLFKGSIWISPRLGGMSLLSSRILHDIPEVIDNKCIEDPDFKFCEIQEDIHIWSDPDILQRLTFKGRLKLNLSWDEFNELSKEMVFYSLKGNYLKHLLALFQNTYALISSYDLSHGVSSLPKDSAPVRGLKRWFPDDLDDYLKSWQASGRVKKALIRLETPLSLLFGLTFIICLVYIVYHWKTRHEDVIVKLSCFAVIAVFLNAFIMSVMSGPFSRFHTRIGFLMIFPAFIIVSRLIEHIKNKNLFLTKE